MARAMVINYGFSEIGPFSLLDPSAQVGGVSFPGGGPCSMRSMQACGTPALRAHSPLLAGCGPGWCLASARFDGCPHLPNTPHPPTPPRQPLQSQDMIMRMMARNSVSENLQQKIDSSVKQIATEAYEQALKHIRWAPGPAVHPRACLAFLASWMQAGRAACLPAAAPARGRTPCPPAALAPRCAGTTVRRWTPSSRCCWRRRQ